MSHFRPVTFSAITRNVLLVKTAENVTQQKSDPPSRPISENLSQLKFLVLQYVYHQQTASELSHIR